MKKKIVFIINPISGGIRKNRIPGLINQVIDRNLFDIEIAQTRSSDHNLELAANAVASAADIVVAIGGDGTINHIAKYVTGSGKLMGIVPLGSGNGLARHLGIPLNPEKALRLINRMNKISIDTATANGHFFLNVAGTGFDAHVSRLFATAPHRGFYSYTKITLKEFARYQPEQFNLIIDGRLVNTDAFILCVANGSQYGNNAFIAPGADLQDGMLDISVIKPFRSFHLPVIGTHLFTRRFNRSPYIDNYSGKEIIIRRSNPGYINIDGEAIMMEPEVTIKLLPLSLNILIP